MPDERQTVGYHVHIITDGGITVRDISMLQQSPLFCYFLHRPNPRAAPLFAPCSTQRLYLHEHDGFRQISEVTPLLSGSRCAASCLLCEHRGNHCWTPIVQLLNNLRHKIALSSWQALYLDIDTLWVNTAVILWEEVAKLVRSEAYFAMAVETTQMYFNATNSWYKGGEGSISYADVMLSQSKVSALVHWQSSLKFELPLLLLGLDRIQQGPSILWKLWTECWSFDAQSQGIEKFKI